jgi:hypothetical protein
VAVLPGDGSIRARVGQLAAESSLATIATEASMIQLSDEQRRELRANGRIIRALDPETRTEFVVIAAELYERLLKMAYDDSPWTDEEMDALASEAFGSLKSSDSE